MSVNLDALEKEVTPKQQEEEKLVETPSSPPAQVGMCYIFYTTVKNLENGKPVRLLMREEITFENSNEVADKVARSMYALFTTQPIEWVCVTPSSSLPDLKYLHSQNEIFNLRQIVEELAAKGTPK